MNNRANSVRGERAVGVFLDKYFYPKLIENGFILSYEREMGIENDEAQEAQMKGTDIVLTFSNEDSSRCDEKAQTSRLLKEKEELVFGLELDFYSEKADKIVDGWFVSKENNTDRYIFVWLKRVRKEKVRDDGLVCYNRLVADDINEAEVIIISKKVIKDWLSDRGYNDEELIQIAKDMRLEGENKRIEKPLDEDSGTVRYSGNILPEQPINLRVGKNVLIEKCDGYFRVEKENEREQVQRLF